MIHSKYSNHLQALRYGAIEAMLATEGSFNATHLGDLFSTHRCNAAKIIKKYIFDENIDVMYFPNEKRFKAMPQYEQKVLKEDTNPYLYLKMLRQLLGKEEISDAEDHKEVL